MQAMTPRVTASTVSLRAFGFQPNAWPLIEELSGFPNRRPNGSHGLNLSAPNSYLRDIDVTRHSQQSTFEPSNTAPFRSTEGLGYARGGRR
jgi:hypothetical protein